MPPKCFYPILTSTYSLQSFLARLAALTNAALVYLFRPDNFPSPDSSSIPDGSAIDLDTPTDGNPTFHINTSTSHVALLLPALLVALGASHVHGLARTLIRHILERALWKGGKEAQMVENGEAAVKGWFLKSLGVGDVEVEMKELGKESGDGADPEDGTGFWSRDEGLEEIRKNLKDS